ANTDCSPWAARPTRRWRCCCCRQAPIRRNSTAMVSGSGVMSRKIIGAACPDGSTHMASRRTRRMSESNTAVSLRIDFVSDVVCPWCAIGLASLEQALLRLRGEVEAELHFQPFELAPDMPAEGMEVAENLKRKYGMSDAQLAENQERIRARGADLGFTFAFKARSRTWNTFDAHRLLHWAEGEGAGRQLALKRALLVANFSEGRNIGDHATL